MMELHLITPQEEILKATVRCVTIPGRCGQFQVLPGHTALLSLVQPGSLCYETTTGKSGCFAVGAGHAEVVDEVVTVAVDDARPE
ncbi:MAG: hypothetical protein HYV02_08485 [Deltaproteobacteria bacterium]|nr:hypothetical protein [Deltaproteobacteria bacterium]